MTPDQFRAARDRLKLTQQGAADALGVHRVTIARWEGGNENIPVMAELALEALGHRQRRRRSLEKKT